MSDIRSKFLCATRYLAGQSLPADYSADRFLQRHLPPMRYAAEAPFRRSLLPLDQAGVSLTMPPIPASAHFLLPAGNPFSTRRTAHPAALAGAPAFPISRNKRFSLQEPRRRFSARISRLAEALPPRTYTFWIRSLPDPELHESMRGLPDVMKGIERALPIFHDHGIFPSANLGITKAILPKRTAAQTGSEATCEEFRAGFRAFYRAY